MSNFLISLSVALIFALVFFLYSAFHRSRRLVWIAIPYVVAIAISYLVNDEWTQRIAIATFSFFIITILNVAFWVHHNHIK
jgi:hypothetical protein